MHAAARRLFSPLASKWWLAVLAGCVVLASLRSMTERQRASDARQRHKHNQLYYCLSPDVGRVEEDISPPLRRLLLAAPRRKTSNHAVEYSVSGSSFDKEYAGWTAVLIVASDPDAGFKSPILLCKCIAPPPGVVLRNGASWAWWMVEYLRVAVLIAAMVSSIAGLITILLVWRERRRLAVWCLTAALVGLFASSLALDYHNGSLWQGSATWVDLCALLAVVSVILRVVPGRSQPNGRCAACGYNLTGNQSGICPECGLPTPRFIRAQRRAAFLPAASRLDLLQRQSIEATTPDAPLAATERHERVDAHVDEAGERQLMEEVSFEKDQRAVV